LKARVYTQNQELVFYLLRTNFSMSFRSFQEWLFEKIVGPFNDPYASTGQRNPATDKQELTVSMVWKEMVLTKDELKLLKHPELQWDKYVQGRPVFRGPNQYLVKWKVRDEWNGLM